MSLWSRILKSRVVYWSVALLLIIPPIIIFVWTFHNRHVYNLVYIYLSLFSALESVVLRGYILRHYKIKGWSIARLWKEWTSTLRGLFK